MKDKEFNLTTCKETRKQSMKPEGRRLFTHVNTDKNQGTIQMPTFAEKKVSLEEQKAQKEDRFLRGRQIAFMIYDYFRVTGAHDTVLDYADLFSVPLHDDNIEEFDTRWDKVFCYLCQRFHPMISWKVCTN